MRGVGGDGLITLADQALRRQDANGLPAMLLLVFDYDKFGDVQVACMSERHQKQEQVSTATYVGNVLGRLTEFLSEVDCQRIQLVIPEPVIGECDQALLAKVAKPIAFIPRSDNWRHCGINPILLALALAEPDRLWAVVNLSSNPLPGNVAGLIKPDRGEVLLLTSTTNRTHLEVGAPPVSCPACKFGGVKPIEVKTDLADHVVVFQRVGQGEAARWKQFFHRRDSQGMTIIVPSDEETMFWVVTKRNVSVNKDNGAVQPGNLKALGVPDATLALMVVSDEQFDTALIAHQKEPSLVATDDNTAISFRREVLDIVKARWIEHVDASMAAFASDNGNSSRLLPPSWTTRGPGLGLGLGLVGLDRNVSCSPL
jgi:hypothetical protein